MNRIGYESLPTDPRSYESRADDTFGDVLPVDGMADPVQPFPDFTEYPMVHPPEAELEGDTSRRIRAALAEQAIGMGIEDVDEYVDQQLADVRHRLGGQISTENTTPAEIESLQDKNLDVATALQLLYKEAGFYARDNEEKNSMQAIMGRSDVGYPTLNYFDEVEYHQRKAATTDPLRALRKLTRNFESYATEAVKETQFSLLFKKLVDERGLNMNQKLSSQLSVEDVFYDDPTRRTLTSLALLKETELFIENKADNPLGVNAGVNSLKGKERVKRIFELLDTMQLSGLMKLNEKYVADQNRRFEYWKDRLIEARMRSSIRATVDESLKHLDALRPSDS